MSKEYFIERDCCPCCKSDIHNQLYSCVFTDPHIKNYLIEFYSSQGFKIDTDLLENVDFILDECLNCGVVYQRIIPNRYLMKKLYEEWLNPETEFVCWKNNLDLDYFCYFANELMTIVAFFNKKPSKLTFLDFAMGWGMWSQMAKAFGCEVYGSELSEPKIEYAKSQGIKIIRWEEIPDHEFDFINNEQVFEHIPEPLETLCHLRSSLKPEGIIKIAVPDGNDIKRRLKTFDWKATRRTRNSLNAVSPLEHINCYSHKAIIRMAAQAELERVKIPISYQYRYSTNWKNARQAIKNIGRPIYRNFFKTTVLYFRHKRN
jgi:2-polyprenyl-3-methyl-5-hydroxy-6-metoxy-1,4-benzoquinol methylase